MTHTVLIVAASAYIVAAAGAAQAPAQRTLTDIAGTYNLATVNGNELPYNPPAEPGGPSISITAGTLSIKSDGVCSSRISVVLPSGESAVEVAGTCTREDTKVTIQWDRAGRTSGTIKGETFTMENDGLVFGYKKAK